MKTNIFHIGAVMWSLIAVVAFSCRTAHAGTGLEFGVPPFDTQIYELRHEESGEMITMEECLIVREEFIHGWIKENNISILEGIKTGDFIFRCVETLD